MPDIFSAVVFAVVGGILVSRLVSCVKTKITRHKETIILKTVTDIHRGTASERRLLLDLIKAGIPKNTIFHDLYVPKPMHRYAQVDVVVPTRVGIIVFEVKDYKGWIFGKGYQKYWTQVLNYRRLKIKKQFYNPFFQNNGHVEALKQILKYCGDVPFFSVIIFYGKCVLKDVSQFPVNSYIGNPSDVGKILTDILDNNPQANYNDKWEVVNQLKAAVMNGNDEEIVSRHILSVNYLAK